MDVAPGKNSVGPLQKSLPHRCVLYQQAEQGNGHRVTLTCMAFSVHKVGQFS